MEEVGTDQTCGRCGEFVRLAVIDTSGESVVDPLHCLFETRATNRRILVASCDCDPPRVTGLTGAPVFDAEFTRIASRNVIKDDGDRDE